MKKRKKIKASSKLPRVSEIKYIPPELLTRIFETLPVKTLVRFRSVCKSWNSIIDDPTFVDKHSVICKNYSTDNELLASLDGIGCYAFEPGELTPIKRRNTPGVYTGFYLIPYYRSGICNGLILMEYEDLFTIWNPSIRKSLKLPSCPFPSKLRKDVQYVFGFAAASNDYKVIAFVYEPFKVSRKKNIAVYTLSDQRWTHRNHSLNLGYCWYGYDFTSSDFYFQGAVHWFGADPCKVRDTLIEKMTHLVSLNFDTENFTFLELPSAQKEWDALKFLFRLGESLAVFYVSSLSSSIWVLDQDGRNGPWTLWFSGKSSANGCAFFEDKLREYYWDSFLFFCEKNGGYFICWNKTYNITSCQVQELDGIDGYTDVKMYTESLMLCKGYEAKDIISS